MNGSGKLSWLKVRADLIITIVTLIVGFTIAWTQLKAQVNDNANQIFENKKRYENLIGELKEINNLLNDKETGLPAIHQRLKNLEKY